MSRAAAIGALLALLPAAVVTYASRPVDVAPRGDALGEKIPHALGPWTGSDHALDAATLDYLRTDDYVNRTYAAPGEPPVELTIVFSRKERKTVHPPEICLQAQGWELFGRTETPLAADGAGVTAASMHLARETQRLDVLTWYVAGGEATPSFVRQQWNVAVAPLTGAPRGSALVRIMCATPVAGPRERGAAALGRFVDAALPRIVASFR